MATAAYIIAQGEAFTSWAFLGVMFFDLVWASVLASRR